MSEVLEREVLSDDGAGVTGNSVAHLLVVETTNPLLLVGSNHLDIKVNQQHQLRVKGMEMRDKSFGTDGYVDVVFGDGRLELEEFPGVYLTRHACGYICIKRKEGPPHSINNTAFFCFCTGCEEIPVFGMPFCEVHEEKFRELEEEEKDSPLSVVSDGVLPPVQLYDGDIYEEIEYESSSDESLSSQEDDTISQSDVVEREINDLAALVTNWDDGDFEKASTSSSTAALEPTEFRCQVDGEVPGKKLKLATSPLASSGLAEDDEHKVLRDKIRRKLADFSFTRARKKKDGEEMKDAVDQKIREIAKRFIVDTKPRASSSCTTSPIRKETPGRLERKRRLSDSRLTAAESVAAKPSHGIRRNQLELFMTSEKKGDPGAKTHRQTKIVSYLTKQPVAGPSSLMYQMETKKKKKGYVDDSDEDDEESC